MKSLYFYTCAEVDGPEYLFRAAAYKPPQSNEHDQFNHRWFAVQPQETQVYLRW
ncbi:hypothetical protein CDL12_19321 [Handroanthus impetiginosus]|uniref:Uncharacterized protein n=1 Tax=Handroanthus impetiginosus TaxID=429701 RepID=A0A2G9GS72_9LAMI|nr:hypothetical protein CDL12_19321 [Handroanthus impetiginosus]